MRNIRISLWSLERSDLKNSLFLLITMSEITSIQMEPQDSHPICVMEYFLYDNSTIKLLLNKRIFLKNEPMKSLIYQNLLGENFGGKYSITFLKLKLPSFKKKDVIYSGLKIKSYFKSGACEKQDTLSLMLRWDSLMRRIGCTDEPEWSYQVSSQKTCILTGDFESNTLKKCSLIMMKL